MRGLTAATNATAGLRSSPLCTIISGFTRERSPTRAISAVRVYLSFFICLLINSRLDDGQVKHFGKESPTWSTGESIPERYRMCAQLVANPSVTR